eukprot:6182489-Pleurochrysis_carterae.AAC.1
MNAVARRRSTFKAKVQGDGLNVAEPPFSSVAGKSSESATADTSDVAAAATDTAVAGASVSQSSDVADGLEDAPAQSGGGDNTDGPPSRKRRLDAGKLHWAAVDTESAYTGSVFLHASSQLSLTAHEDYGQLLLVTNETGNLDTQGEVDLITEALGPHSVIPLRKVTIRKLELAMQKYADKVVIAQFIGHCHGGFAFHLESSSKLALLDSAYLADRLAACERLRCVVLNADCGHK